MLMTSNDLAQRQARRPFRPGEHTIPWRARGGHDVQTVRCSALLDGSFTALLFDDLAKEFNAIAANERTCTGKYDADATLELTAERTRWIRRIFRQLLLERGKLPQRFVELVESCLYPRIVSHDVFEPSNDPVERPGAMP